MKDNRAVVFVIDDDASMRGALDNLLSSVGLDVRVFPSPQEFLSAERPHAPGCIDTLSPREREVMGLVADGRANKQIAAELGVSLVTVKVHRGHVMHKMLAQSVADLVRMSDQLGLRAASGPIPRC